jgi:hypothetical protein
VSRQDGNVVSQGKQFGLDSLEQLLAVAAGKVPTTNATGKENVAANQKLFVAQKEANAARAMTWDFEYLKLNSQKIALTRLLDKKIRRYRFDFEAEAEVAEKSRVRNHRCGIRVATDRAVKSSLDFRNVPDVINVSVGEEQ